MFFQRIHVQNWERRRKKKKRHQKVSAFSKKWQQYRDMECVVHGKSVLCSGFSWSLSGTQERSDTRSAPVSEQLLAAHRVRNDGRGGGASPLLAPSSFKMLPLYLAPDYSRLPLRRQEPRQHQLLEHMRKITNRFVWRSKNKRDLKNNFGML